MDRKICTENIEYSFEIYAKTSDIFLCFVQKPKKTEITSIQEMMDLLENYSRPQLMDDYYAIKELIEMEIDDNPESNDQKTDENNSNNNTANEKQSEHEIRSFFKSTLGQCKNFSNCKSFVRNRRLRSSDSITNERREAFYIRTEDVQRYKNAGFLRFEVKEVVLQSSLDIIHNYIFHAKDEEMHVNKTHASKFVTEVEMEDDDSKSNNDNGQKVKKMGQYSFGFDTDYWLKSHPFFVPPKYPDLKTELLSNSLHPISLTAYEMLEERAIGILDTRYGQSLKSKRSHEWMKIKGKQLIPKGSLITEKHLISVLSYTNHGEMQYDFKKFGYRKTSEHESDNKVRKRNEEIAHWSRAIVEAIHCWGSVMNRKKPLFHGISCKLGFDRYSYLFRMPTSLTTNVRIAQNFAKENGIILVLKHAQEKDDQSLMFDVSLMSDFPNEEERLIYRTKVQFYDILVDGKSLKQWMKVLRFYERITMGRFLSHVPFSVSEQEMIVHMIENYMQDLKGKSNKNDEFYVNGNVPNYIQLLFNECTDGCHAGFYVNSYAIKNAITDEQLLQYLDGSQDGKNSKFLSIFKSVLETHVNEWLIAGDDYVSFFSPSHSWIIDHQKYRINIAKKSADTPLYFEFYWQLCNSKRNDMLWCLLRCDHLPNEVSGIFINFGLYINETSSESFMGAYINHQSLYAGGLHSIIDSKNLLIENNPNMKQKEFHIKLCVAVTDCTFK